MRRRTKSAVITLVLGATITASLQSAATASVSGGVTFHCTAHLPAWAAPEAAGTCGNGVTPAFAHVTLSGQDASGRPYAVEGVGGFSAAFQYANACIANEPPLLGAASGQAIVTAVPATIAGAATTATVSASFSWQRVGAAATIAIYDLSVEFGDGSTATPLVTRNQGHAVFVPVASADNTCSVGGPVEALVVGEVGVAA